MSLIRLVATKNHFTKEEGGGEQAGGDKSERYKRPVKCL